MATKKMALTLKILRIWATVDLVMTKQNDGSDRRLWSLAAQPQATVPATLREN